MKTPHWRTLVLALLVVLGFLFLIPAGRIFGADVPAQIPEDHEASQKKVASTSDASGTPTGDAVGSINVGGALPSDIGTGNPSSGCKSDGIGVKNCAPAVDAIPTPLPPISTPPVQANDVGTRVLIDTVTPPTPLPPSTTEPQPATTPAPAPIPDQNQTTDTQANKAAKQEAQSQLEDVGASLRKLQQEVKRVDVKVRSAVSEQVDAALQKATSESVTAENGQTVHAFDPVEREKKLKELKSAIAAKQDKISEDVRTSISSGDVNSESANKLEPVLKSSLSDIELLIKADTGVSVDLSKSAPAVVSVVADNTKELNQARADVTSQGGLDLYKDTDHDGVSDYDEVHIYHTDPYNAYSAGSLVTDGERILLGLDPHSKATAQVPVESPQTAGEEVQGLFEVHSINVSLQPIVASTTASTTVATAASSTSGVLPAFREEVTIAGRALPYSFVTLYIFSTPVVVTVKADVSGAWSYTLNSELPDGQHKLYVATVDAGGKIVAKSPAVPFVKQAEAAAFTPLLIPGPEVVNPLDVLESNFLVVGGALLLIFAVIAFIMLSLRRVPPPPPAQSA